MTTPPVAEMSLPLTALAIELLLMGLKLSWADNGYCQYLKVQGNEYREPWHELRIRDDTVFVVTDAGHHQSVTTQFDLCDPELFQQLQAFFGTHHSRCRPR